MGTSGNWTIQRMAVLPETLRRFLSDLSEVEQHKYWTIYGEDLDTEIACKNAGHQWNPDTDSSAIRYLQNLKKRKELQLEKDQPAAALVKNGIRASKKLTLNFTSVSFSVKLILYC